MTYDNLKNIHENLGALLRPVAADFVAAPKRLNASGIAFSPIWTRQLLHYLGQAPEPELAAGRRAAELLKDVPGEKYRSAEALLLRATIGRLGPAVLEEGGLLTSKAIAGVIELAERVAWEAQPTPDWGLPQEFARAANEFGGLGLSPGSQQRLTTGDSNSRTLA